MQWFTQTFAVLALNIRTIPARLSSSARRHHRHRRVSSSSSSRCCRSPRASRRRCRAPDLPTARSCLRTRRRQRNDERPAAARTSTSSSRRRASDATGQAALASAELFVIIDLAERSTPDAPANVPVRGIEPESIPLRERVLDRRRPRCSVRYQRSDCRPRRQRPVRRHSTSANTIVSGQNRWEVVGVFEADGGVAETEIWTDARTLQGAYRRGNTYQSLLARLDSRESYDRVSRLAHVESAAQRRRSGAKATTTPRSRRR